MSIVAKISILRLILGACLVVVATVIVVPGVRNGLVANAVIACEEAMLIFDPSAERAYEYGNRHFEASRSEYYDINRARVLYDKAFELDPEYPYLQHQRARIAFLKANYTIALASIDDEIQRNPNPSSYYMRGLIRGFVGDYSGAASDYEMFLREKSTSWAAINDYAWVLLKADRPLDALIALDWGLIYSPENVWLFNNKATAHFELGQYELAYEAALRAQELVGTVSEAEWLRAYPGNDPLIASEGIEALKNAIEINIHTISLAIEKQGNDVP
jgi:tetratricopeptide (TPR) repeat protein